MALLGLSMYTGPVDIYSKVSDSLSSTLFPIAYWLSYAAAIKPFLANRSVAAKGRNAQRGGESAGTT